MINDIKNTAEQRMQKSVAAMQTEMAKIRTGRAHPNLLEAIMVPYYGNDTPLTQVANISVTDACTLTVAPWEKSLLPAIEKAILTADLGLNPATSGDVLRVPLPPLTEERRKDMTKIARTEAEHARIAIRNIRRDANNQLKDLLKNKDITEDEEHNAQDAIQKLTDKYIKEADGHLATKEADLMEV